MIKKEYKHAKSKLSNVEAYNIVKRLKKADKSRTEIADALKEAGYLTPNSGRQVNLRDVSAMLGRNKKHATATRANKLPRMARPPKDKTNAIVKSILKETSISAEDRIMAALFFL